MKRSSPPKFITVYSATSKKHLFSVHNTMISISILRRLQLLKKSSSSSSLHNSLSKPIVDSNSTTMSGAGGGGSRSQRLLNLATQLRLYKPPLTIYNGDDEFKNKVDDGRKIVSQEGFAEFVTPIGRSDDRGSFRPKRAAILICLFEGDDGDFRVILTKRSSRLSTHSGEVSLPGGKAEEGDKDDADTATREAKEEIGLDPSLVNIVTVLEPFLSKHLLRVIPVIGILSDKKAFKPTPNSAEVEAVFDAPLEMFLKDENHTSEEREWKGHKYLVHYFDYETDSQKYLIWGLTSGILIKAASVVYKRPPPFLEQRPYFKMHSRMS